MRFSSAVFLLSLTLGACNSNQPASESTNPPAVAPEARDTTQAEASAAPEAPLPAGVQSFGKRIDEAGAVPIAELPTLLAGKDSVEVKLVAEVADVCQVKGCWMKLPQADGQSMRVSFKDYAFFVPKDAKGKTTVVEGWAKKTVTSVEELRHYAEDAGKSRKEIAAITKPETGVSFEAEGVLLK